MGNRSIDAFIVSVLEIYNFRWFLSIYWSCCCPFCNLFMSMLYFRLMTHVKPFSCVRVFHSFEGIFLYIFLDADLLTHPFPNTTHLLVPLRFFGLLICSGHFLLGSLIVIASRLLPLWHF